MLFIGGKKPAKLHNIAKMLNILIKEWCPISCLIEIFKFDLKDKSVPFGQIRSTRRVKIDKCKWCTMSQVLRRGRQKIQIAHYELST